MKTNELEDAKEIKQFIRKIWEQTENNRKDKWMNNMKK